MKPILVAGAGPSARTAAEEVVNQGGEVIRIVLPDELPDLDCLHGVLLDVQGTQGNFTAVIETSSGVENIPAGAAILAVDEISKKSSGIFAPLSSAEDASGTIVMLLDAKRPSRSSHITAVHKAITIKKNHADSKIYIITPEVRTFGQDELEYCEAQKLGIIFVRAEEIVFKHGELKVVDSSSGRVLHIQPDIVISDEEQEVKNGPYWSKAFSIALYEDGHFRLGNVSRGPATSIRNGIFLCGTASRALLPREMDTSARAAATRAVTAALNPLQINAASADAEKCAGCLTCVRSCLFQAPHINEEGKSEIREDLCQGCGLCINLCPVSAISLKGSQRADLNNTLDSILRCHNG